MWAVGRSQVSWLRAPRRAFPESRRLPSGYMRRLSARSQWRDRAGFTPDFPRPPAVERAQHTPPWADPKAAARIARRTEPPSSRGLGRRPLTAETGVRIPVAVLREAPRTRSFDRSGRRCATYCATVGHVRRPTGPLRRNELDERAHGEGPRPA